METIFQSLKSALDFDQAKQYPQAYVNYIQCLDQISQILKKPVRNVNISNLFQISKQCLERSEFLYKNFTDQDWNFFQQSKQETADYEKLKKQVEKNALEKLQQESQKEELLKHELVMKRERDLAIDKQINNLKMTWAKSSGWKLSDKFTDLLDQNFKYEYMSRDMILRDQIWIEKVKKESNACNIAVDHIKVILSEKEYPLQSLLMLFIVNFQRDFSQKALMQAKNEVVFLQNALDDIDLFLNRLTYSLVIKYWGFTTRENLINTIDSRELEETLKSELMSFIMKNGMYLTLLSIYHIQTRIRDKNEIFANKVKQYKNVRLNDIGIQKSLDISYAQVVSNLFKMEICEVPTEKMNLLMVAVQSVAQCVTNHYKLNQLILFDIEIPQMYFSILTHV